MLQIQSKRFYIDVKQNRRGRFVKIAEVSAARTVRGPAADARPSVRARCRGRGRQLLTRVPPPPPSRAPAAPGRGRRECTLQTAGVYPALYCLAAAGPVPAPAGCPTRAAAAAATGRATVDIY